jgi:hypothetical protein
VFYRRIVNAITGNAVIKKEGFMTLIEQLQSKGSCDDQVSERPTDSPQSPVKRQANKSQHDMDDNSTDELLKVFEGAKLNRRYWVIFSLMSAVLCSIFLIF